MKLTTSYGVKIRDAYPALNRTAGIFSDAVAYLVPPVLDHWDVLKDIESSLDRRQLVEHLVHSSLGHAAVYDFDDRFRKFPSYYLRAAITQALGVVSAYKSAVRNWQNGGCKGAEPKMDACAHRMPALYRGNTYKPVVDKSTGEVMPYLAQIKVFRNNDWVWQTVRLSKTDMDYLSMRGRKGTTAAPVLEKKHGCWKLRFAVTENVCFPEIPVMSRKICAVDLGLTTDATCCAMDAHGTVLARRFITCGREQDLVHQALHRVSVFQALHGSHDSGRLWNLAKRQNGNLADQVSREIINFAIENDCDVIVFEHLGTKGKKRGRRKQKLAMWKHADIQNTVESLAHHYGIRISHINACNTSRLAYDGSGRVKRGWAVSDSTPYDICQFTSGKMYNCDLNASYNIGARYFIRELFKELPALQAEVPEVGSGTQRTLADLWWIDAYINLPSHA